MRKLFLSFVLVMTSVVMFAQSNSSETEAEKVSSTEIASTLGGGLMVRDGLNLKLDGRILSDSEVRDLVGEANYETYLDAKKQIKKGKTYQGIFIGSTFATVALLAVGAASRNLTILYIGYIPAIVADVSLPLMCIFKGIGKGRMSWVADDYNEHNKTQVSYSFSPSIMRVNAQPDQANLGAGMTFSLNF